MLRELEEIVFDVIKKELGTQNDISTDIVEEFLNESFDDLSKDFFKSYESLADARYISVLEEEQEFTARNISRWRKSLELLSAQWEICTEISQMHFSEIAEQMPPRDTALSQLVPRGLLVAKEAICLLQSGFADGAMARWRTLHEINVTANFISKHGDRAGLLYLYSFPFAARRAAKNYIEYQERAQLQPFDKSSLDAIEAECDRVRREIGFELKSDLDWASDFIGAKKGRITLFDLESDVGLDHWRPRYRWASQHNHAAYRPSDRLLGMSEAKADMHLIGPSNSGLSDPIQMVAISLQSLVTTSLLTI